MYKVLCIRCFRQQTQWMSTYDPGAVSGHQGLIRREDLSLCKYPGIITKTIHSIRNRVQTGQCAQTIDWGIQKLVWSEMLSSAVSHRDFRQSHRNHKVTVSKNSCQNTTARTTQTFLCLQDMYEVPAINNRLKRIHCDTLDTRQRKRKAVFSFLCGKNSSTWGGLAVTELD